MPLGKSNPATECEHIQYLKIMRFANSAHVINEGLDLRMSKLHVILNLNVGIWIYLWKKIRI